MTARFNQTVLQNLTEVEKMRFVCAYLYHQSPSDVDWDGAATQAGSASKNSFKVSFGNTMKKIREAPAEGDGTAPSTAQATPKKGRKKRVADQADVDGQPAKKTPKKTRAKKSDVESKNEANNIKTEPVNDDRDLKSEDEANNIKTEPINDDQLEQSEGQTEG